MVVRLVDLLLLWRKGSKATGSDIAWSAVKGAAMGAVAGPLLEKIIPALVKGTQSGIKAGQYAQGSIADKLWAGTQAFGKSIGRQTMRGTNEAIMVFSSAYQNAKLFNKRYSQKKVPVHIKTKLQSLLSTRSENSRIILLKYMVLKTKRLVHWNMGEKSVSDAMKKWKQ